MASEKQPTSQTQVIIDTITENHAILDSPEMLGTTHDQKDMYRMGKVQQLRVCQILQKYVHDIANHV